MSEAAETGSFLHLGAIDTREDLLALIDRLHKEIHAREIEGAIVISIRTDGKGRRGYSLHLGGWAATHLTFSHGAMDACTMLTRELALQEGGVL